MDETRAREILGDLVTDPCCPYLPYFDGLQREDLSPRTCFVYYENGIMYSMVSGMFTADELEAIAWWARNMAYTR